MANFRFSPSILARLGEELNPHLDQGVIELVKNAYDADATRCVVRLNLEADGYIEVQDDGLGMSASQVVDNWLVLGSSEKVTSRTTPGGRNPAGNKGLGRLAALRLGRVAHLTTVSQSMKKISSLTLDWDQFDSADTVDAVELTVKERAVADGASGTVVRMESLRTDIGRMDVKRLARSMILLADPFSDSPGSFTPVLEAPDFDDLADLVARRYFDEAEYHLRATLIEGKASAVVTDFKGSVLFSTEDLGSESKSAENKAGQFDCPDSTFDLWAFKLTGDTFALRNTSLGEVKDWLEAFGGVHVYSNGLRVAPYGNSGNDWLDMNLARVRSPEDRPSTNNSIGRVQLVDPNGTLSQKTDRGGFVESPAFDELRRFAREALDWMARRRTAVAEERRRTARNAEKSESASRREDVSTQIARLGNTDAARELSTAFRSYDSAREREVRGLRKEVQLYRTLSTAGITTATFAHESSGSPIKAIEIAAGTLRWSLNEDLDTTYYERVVRPPLTSIVKATDSLGVLASATLRLIHADKRRIGRVDPDKTVEEVLDTYAPFLEGRAVEVEATLNATGFHLRGSEAAVEAIVTNLINNSLAAFERADSAGRRILVESRVSANGIWNLVVSDSGPGIVDISLEDIWLPGETRRDNGTGLGLTIVRDSVTDLGGTAEAVANGPLGGAVFSIAVPAQPNE
jgi:signal transduction histidine kinase